MKEEIELNILGQSLVVKSSEGAEQVREVAACLEEQIEDVRRNTGTVDSLRIMLYAAFKLAGENLKAKKELSRLEEEIDSASNNLLEIIE